jgi:hypothetical protein
MSRKQDNRLMNNNEAELKTIEKCVKKLAKLESQMAKTQLALAKLHLAPTRARKKAAAVKIVLE